MYSLQKVSNSLKNPNVSRLLHSTSMALIDMKWRRSERLPEDILDEPEFLDRPDYSYLDGRPTPLGQELLQRYNDEKRLAEAAVKYLGHIEHALNLREMEKIAKEEEAQAILSRKLKPKGSYYKPKYNMDNSG